MVTSKVNRSKIKEQARAFMLMAKEMGIVDHGAVNSMGVTPGSHTYRKDWQVSWVDCHQQRVYLNYSHGCDLTGAVTGPVAFDRLARATATLRAVKARQDAHKAGEPRSRSWREPVHPARPAMVGGKIVGYFADEG